MKQGEPREAGTSSNPTAVSVRVRCLSEIIIIVTTRKYTVSTLLVFCWIPWVPEAVWQLATYEVIKNTIH